MESSVLGDNFVRQILESTVSQKMQTDKDRLLAQKQIESQQTTLSQKTQVVESLLDVYA